MTADHGRDQVGPGARDSTGVIHQHLRESILRGELPAGTGLSQATIARDFGVSRGPVREALRLLQREGLIDAEVNHRPRVAPMSPDDLEQLYAMRIVIESLAISLSVPWYDRDDFAELQRCLADMERFAGNDVEQWEQVHLEFHATLVGYAGDRLLATIRQLADHSERYRRVYLDQGPRVWTVGAIEHQEIVDACLKRDAGEASIRLGRHLARTATTVMMTLAPEHDVAGVRQAVRQVTGALAQEGSPRRVRSELPNQRQGADASVDILGA